MNSVFKRLYKYVLTYNWSIYHYYYTRSEGLVVLVRSQDGDAAVILKILDHSNYSICNQDPESMEILKEFGE